uniref:Uncharacterized protein n=1 Tax=Megaselia scalaris TaxID=36166 RepID=T1GZI5_MEGSC
METNLSPIYKTSAQQKLQSKTLAHKYKAGLGDLRKLLREVICTIQWYEQGFVQGLLNAYKGLQRLI